MRDESDARAWRNENKEGDWSKKVRLCSAKLCPALLSPDLGQSRAAERDHHCTTYNKAAAKKGQASRYGS
jgi:hypothetical protein